MSDQQQKQFDRNVEKSLEIFRTLKNHKEAEIETLNVKLTIACDSQLIDLWRTKSSIYFNGQWPLQIGNSNIRLNLSGWRDTIKYLNAQFSQSIILGKFAEAFQMAVNEYELRTEYCEILQYPPLEHVHALAEICENLSKVLYVLVNIRFKNFVNLKKFIANMSAIFQRWYKEAIAYCHLGLQYCIENMSNINLTVIANVCIEEMHNLFPEEENLNLLENLPHRQIKWFEMLLTSDNVLSKKNFLNRVLRFLNLENFINVANFVKDEEKLHSLFEQNAALYKEEATSKEQLQEIAAIQDAIDSSVETSASEKSSSKKTLKEIKKNNQKNKKKQKNKSVNSTVDQKFKQKESAANADVVVKSETCQNEINIKQQINAAEICKDEDLNFETGRYSCSVIPKRTTSESSTGSSSPSVKSKNTPSTKATFIAQEMIAEGVVDFSYNSAEEIVGTYSTFATRNKFDLLNSSSKPNGETSNLQDLNEIESATKTTRSHQNRDQCRALCSRLKELFHFQLGCCAALRESRFSDRLTANHVPHPDCPADVLLCHPVRVKGSWLVKVRTPNHIPEDCNGHYQEYKICDSLSMNEDCDSKDDCSYSHSPEELTIWNMIHDSHVEYVTIFEMLKASFINEDSNNKSSIIDHQSTNTVIFKTNSLTADADQITKDDEFTLVSKKSSHEISSSANFLEVADLNSLTPLFSSHKFHLACYKCHSISTNDIEIFDHDCKKNILLCHDKNVLKRWIWHRVRPLPNISGQNISHISMCKEHPRCSRSNRCTSAHSETEYMIWIKELKERKTLIPINFIDNLACSLVLKSGRQIELNSLCRVYVWVGCKECVTIIINGWLQIFKFAHKCKQDKILFRDISWEHQFWVIIRPCLEGFGQHELCRHIERNDCWDWTTCKFAHSEMEWKLWCEDYGGTKVPNLNDLLKLELINRRQSGPHFKTIPLKMLPATTAVGRAHGKSTVAGKHNGNGTASQFVQKRQVSCENEPFQSPFKVHYICGLCFTRLSKMVTFKHPTLDRCDNKNEVHPWNVNKKLMIFDEGGKYHDLRPVPHTLPNSGHSASICKLVAAGNKCLRSVCLFAHSDVEKRCWNFLVKRGKNVDEIISEPELSNAQNNMMHNQAVTTKSAFPAIPAWGLQPNNASVEIEAMKGLLDNALYCFLCDKKYQNEQKYEEHCSFDEHVEKVKMDDMRTWACRPPHGRPPFNLCKKHINNETCLYSNSPSNFCPEAHCENEIDEWQERLLFLKKESSRKANEILNMLIERMKNAKIVSSVEFAQIDMNGSKSVAMSADEKGKKFHWTFSITAEKPLIRVALMKKQFHFYFRLASPYSSNIGSNACNGEMFYDNSIECYYEVQVDFLGSRTCGTFHQEVIFDFGDDVPLVKHDLTVHVGMTAVELNGLSEMSKILSSDDFWTADNVLVHWISKQRYQKVHAPNDVIANLHLQLNEQTYFKIMRKMILAEEMKRQSILASFRLHGKAIIGATLASEKNTPIFPKHKNSLFAAVPLDFELSEDFDTAELLINDCEYAFVHFLENKSAETDPEKRHVHEVEIVGRRNYGFEGINQNFIYLCLSPYFVSYWMLEPGYEIPIEVQFNLLHEQFASWLKCVDVLEQKDMAQLVYPNLLSRYNRYLTGEVYQESKEKITQMRYLEHNWKKSNKNEEQIKVLQHVVMCAVNKTHWVPPVVIYGPFGTGKTRTLAEAVCTLLTQPKLHETKMLICTQSNSTADLYLKLFESYDGLNTDSLKDLIWRMVPSHTKSVNLSPHVKPYVRFDENEQLEELTLEKLQKIRVVISTTSGVYRLTRLLEDISPTAKNPVKFSHIFLDEAAQGLEIEMLQPLCIASKMTCIVVAGDHHQIRPKLYFTEVEELQCSYLERLYNCYELQERSMRISEAARSNLIIPKILFTKNYRCHKDILAFLSEAFYGGESTLQSCAEIPDSVFKPMYFASSIGYEEIVSGSGISISNKAEILEAAQQVRYFWTNWPESWGDKDIGVVVGSFDQVKYLRDALKPERYPKNRVEVGKAIMMQGKEFKVLIISTLRGRNLLEKPQTQRRKWGFLDDARLINTAMSRARFCIVVVGDPVVLCSIGDCKHVWQRYTDFCFNNQSFLPETYTSDHLNTEIALYQGCYKGSSINEENDMPDDLSLSVI